MAGRIVKAPAPREHAIARPALALERFADLATRIVAGEDRAKSERLRKAERIGRAVGSADFIASLERQSGRRLPRARPGPKPNGVEAGSAELYALSPKFRSWSEPLG